MTQKTKTPFKKIKAGKISIALWRDETETEGHTIIQYTVEIQKRFGDKQADQWKTVEYLYPADLPNLIICAQAAIEFIRPTETNNNDSQLLLFKEMSNNVSGETEHS